MLVPNTVEHKLLLEDRFEKRLFTRRPDLTDNIRLELATNALHAMMNGAWGKITHLAEEYKLSRTFIYSLAGILKEAGQHLFGEIADDASCPSPQEHAIQFMLSLRLEGRSSIGSISTIMKRFGCELSATGSISQTLSNIGSKLPSTLFAADDITQYVIFASDEIFSKAVPILITVDPCSSAILRIELADSRKAEDWKKHFKLIYDNGIEAVYLVSDEGSGILAGHALAMGDVMRQPDTYHAVAHTLGHWVNRLEGAAYKAIRIEYECERKLNSAKSDQVLEKRWTSYEESIEITKDAVALYDTFAYLYCCIINELNVFDRDGNLRNRQCAEAEISTALTLIEDLNHTNIIDAVNKVRRTLSNLLHYFDTAKKVTRKLKELPINKACLKAYCAAWQWGKAIRKAKNFDRKEKAQEQEQTCLEVADNLHKKEQERDIQEEVYSALDNIVQSSALVECINSIIRPYLNATKNHVTQELLNLIMHYHNHRRYCDGIRKNKTPMEIFTGKEQTKDWISILFDKIREKDPGLLPAS